MAYFKVYIYHWLKRMETTQHVCWNSHCPSSNWKSQTKEYNVWMRWNCHSFPFLLHGYGRGGGGKKWI